jgi:E3 SUMO-protein ligase RanBP2
MASSRIDGLLAMRAKNPADTRILFALALEYEKAERWDDAVTVLAEYLDAADDEGNAWGRLGKALLALGRRAEARAAYARGVEAAEKHGHPSMAGEFAEVVEEIEESG